MIQSYEKTKTKICNKVSPIDGYAMAKKKMNTLTIMLTLLVIVLTIIVILQIITGPINRIVSQPWWVLVLTNFALPLSTACMFLLLTTFLFTDGGGKQIASTIKSCISSGESKKIISEHEHGFKSIPSDFEWNYSKPLKILRIRLSETDLPHIFTKKECGKEAAFLSKFREIQIVVDQSIKTSNARSVALKDEQYRRDNISKIDGCLRFFKRAGLKNIKIVEMDKIQYPYGIIIQNDKYVFYAPLWNHPNTAAGAATDVYLKVPSDSKVGQLMIASFDQLFANGTVVVDYALGNVENTIKEYVDELLKRT